MDSKHLDNLNERLYDQLNDKLLIRFPEFKPFLDEWVGDYNQHTPYMVYGCFAIFMDKEMSYSAYSSNSKLEEYAGFINEIAELKVSEINVILEEMVFDAFMGYKSQIELCKKLFKGQALFLYLKVLNGPQFQGGKGAM